MNECVKQIMQPGITTAKSLNKAVYFFSTSEDNSKVAHLNFVPKGEIVKGGFTAKTWFEKVVEVLGGKGGGKDDGAQGFGTEFEKVQEAIKVAKEFYEKK